MPYTYRPNLWTSRCLSAEEMGAALDFPPNRVKKLSPAEMHDLTVEEVPGKVLGACLWFLGEEQEHSDPRDTLEEKTRALPVELTPSKRARTVMIPEQNQQVYEGIGLDEVGSSANLAIK